ncbi:MAG: hypothetical protein LBU34_14725 [Planctomycetaceae bacterium]|nr:hypothetical protein [Planctomycetaceae bacterium]
MTVLTVWGEGWGVGSLQADFLPLELLIFSCVGISRKHGIYVMLVVGKCGKKVGFY